MKFTVIGWYQFEELPTREVVEAANAGAAAYEIIRRHEKTDYRFMGVIEGSHTMLGGYNQLDPNIADNLAGLPMTSEAEAMTVISFDLFDPTSINADVLMANYWQLAMFSAMSMRGRSSQVVCTVKGAVNLTISAEDIEEVAPYV